MSKQVLIDVEVARLASGALEDSAVHFQQKSRRVSGSSAQTLRDKARVLRAAAIDLRRKVKEADSD